MQARVGKKGSFKGATGIRPEAYSRLGKIIFLFLLTSCGHFSNKPGVPTKKNSIDKICLSAEGRGRVHFKSNKYLFGYSSRLDKDQAKWILGMELPIYGEEVVSFNFSKKSLKKVSGKFFKRLLSQTYEMNNSRYYRSMLNQFMKKINEFLLYYSAQATREMAPFGKIAFTEDGLAIRSQVEGMEYFFLVEALRLKDGYYQLLRISMPSISTGSMSVKNSPIEINLFLTSCMVSKS